MLERPNLSFRSQRDALAQAASTAAVDSTYGQAMQSAQGLIRDAAVRGQQASQAPIGNGVTAEALAALWAGRNGGLTSENSNTSSSTNYKPTNEMAQLIIETAEDIGADPVDLATSISYETAGTFDPRKAGPVTQWGQHRGLIQFGEPQALEYGVDWNDPLYSQLGKGKAISNYFKKNGFRPGMSGLDLYSTINAGAPGKYSASDANNGGAPGDVRDKWENQMSAHRAKALALLGLG